MGRAIKHTKAREKSRNLVIKRRRNPRHVQKIRPDIRAGKERKSPVRSSEIGSGNQKADPQTGSQKQVWNNSSKLTSSLN